MDHEEALKILPYQKEKWEYPSSEGGPEWQGFEGYFSSVDEVSRFVGGFKRTVRGSINLTPPDMTKVQDRVQLKETQIPIGDSGGSRALTIDGRWTDAGARSPSACEISSE